MAVLSPKATVLGRRNLLAGYGNSTIAGVTFRDYIATQALAALLASPFKVSGDLDGQAREFARLAALSADALLEELAK